MPSMNQPLRAAVLAQMGQTFTVHPWITDVTADAIQHFALAVGDDNPRWWTGGGANPVAPPTFLYTAMSGGPWPGAAPDREPLPPAVVLWQGDVWRMGAAVQVGDRISAEAEVIEIQDRPTRSGVDSLRRTERTTFRTSSRGGLRLAELDRTTIIFDRAARRGAHAQTAPPAPAGQDVLADLPASYEEEVKRREMARGRRFEDVAVGDVTGPLTKGPLTLTTMIGWVMGCGFPLAPTNRIAWRYFGQNPDGVLRHPVSGIPDTAGAAHWDDMLARGAGMPRGYDVGSQRISWAAHLVTDWMGEHAELIELSIRLKGPNLLGDVMTFSGVVTATSPGSRTVELDLRGENHRGETTTKGSAVVAFAARTAS